MKIVVMMWGVVLSLSFLSLFPVPVFAQRPPPSPVFNMKAHANEFNDQGKAAYAAEKYGDAIPLFQKAVALDPGEVAYVINLAAALRHAERYEEARALLTTTLPAFPSLEEQNTLQITLADVHFYWGQSFVRLKKDEDAVLHFQAAVEIDHLRRPSDAGYDLDNSGAALLRLRRFREAADAYQGSLTIRRNLKDISGQRSVLPGLGQACRALGRDQEAVEAYEGALTLLPLSDWESRVPVLDGLAKCYGRLGQSDKAKDAHRRSAALTQADALNARGVAASEARHYAEAVALCRQAMTLNPASRVYLINFARNECNLGQYSQAVALLEAKRPLFPETEAQTQLQNEIADTHFGWGKVLEKQKRTAEAIPHYMTAYALDAKWHPKDAPYSLRRAADAQGNLFHFEEAQALSGQEAALYHALADPQGEVSALNNQAAFQIDLNHYPAALEELNAAIALSREGKFRVREGDALLGMGHCLQAMRRPAEAMENYRRAMLVFREMNNHSAEASALRFSGDVCRDVGNYPEALDYFAQSLALSRAQHDQDQESAILNDTGLVYHSLSQYEKAIACYRQSIALDRARGDEDGQAPTLGNMAMAYGDLGHYPEAIRLSLSALAIDRRRKDKKGESDVLVNLGQSYRAIGQYDKAVASLQQALVIQRIGGILLSQATALDQLGCTYHALGQYAKALEFHQQALALSHEAGDRPSEASALNNVGLAYDEMKNYDQALLYYQRALALHRQTGHKIGEASALSNVGNILQGQHKYDEAAEDYRQSIAILNEIGSRDVEAQILNNLGSLLEEQSHFAEALDSYQQALDIHHALGDQNDEGLVLGNLLNFYRVANEPRLAIFYGKQAVNLFQNIRGNVQSLDKDAQKSYLAAHSGAYRMLAEVLFDENRLDEAQQVLKMLKEEEFFDFLGRDPAAAKTLITRAALTPFEAKWLIRWRQAASGSARQAVRREMRQDFHSAPQETINPVSLSAGSSDLDQYFGPGVAAVYTIVAPTKLYLIVATAEKRSLVSSPIKADDLYRKVLAFRNALQDPTRDPRPLAQDLYKIIVAPIEGNLKAAHATTLLWSLDDALRYLPMSALHDGHCYMVERYDNCILTLAAPAHATHIPAVAHWTGLGLGVSHEHPGFDALPGVRAELAGIFGPVVPGTTLLDGQFTQASLLAGLKHGTHPLVHIASHFALSGRDTDSFLLLGDGGHLSMAQMKADPTVFAGVDLLTLSACNTAMEVRSAGGREVEGFGALAQRLGARSVLASLWPVADASTPVLMREFYRLRHASRTMSKASGLRQAQTELLRGKVMASTPPSKTNRAQRAKIAGAANTSLPLFVPDPKAPYAHPYYWAPFVLIGNPQ